MSGDWLEDPEARAWAQRVVDELVPKLTDSALSLSILPEEAGLDDVKFAVELGLSIMLDKPIIIAVVPGRRVPAKLARVADEIVEYDDTDTAGTAQRLGAAIARVLKDDD